MEPVPTSSHPSTLSRVRQKKHTFQFVDEAPLTSK